MRRNFLLLTAFVLVCAGGSSSVFAAAQKPDKVGVYFVPARFVFDGVEMAPPKGQEAFIYNSSTYVPLRFISYALGQAVQWDPETYTVSVKEPDTKERIEIGEYKLNQTARDAKSGEVDVSRIAQQKIEVYFQPITYLFFGEQKKPEEKLRGFIYKDRVYVPMRFVSESIGKKIEWDPKTYTIKADTRDSESQGSGKTDQSGSNGQTGTDEKAGQPSQGGGKPGSASPDESNAGTGAEGGGSGAGAPGGGGGTGGAGGSPGGSDGGGTSEKPTMQSIISQAEASINSLQSRAYGAYLVLYAKYKDEQDAQKKAKIKAEGQSKLNGYDTEFAGIMNRLETALRTNGYDTAVVADYQQQYENAKALALAIVE